MPRCAAAAWTAASTASAGSGWEFDPGPGTLLDRGDAFVVWTGTGVVGAGVAVPALGPHAHSSRVRQATSNASVTRTLRTLAPLNAAAPSRQRAFNHRSC